MQENYYGRYHGTKETLFKLAMKTTLLTVLTLGIYRFWAKTRLRKHFWSSTSFGGDSFEYTGTGLEKLLGFLVAVIILAIYLGIVQMVLFYFGLSMMVDATTPEGQLLQVASIYLTLFAALPLFLFAQYRVRRYKLARTRYRGIRFGMENGAWGFVWRALLHNLLTMLTLGILLPRQTFWLEKYMADRMWYGDQKFEQGGAWKELYAGLKHVLIGVIIMIAAGTLLAFMVVGFGFFVLSVGYLWLIFGLYYYMVFSFNYLSSHKTVGGKISIHSGAETGSVMKTLIGGTVLTLVIAAVVVAIAGGVSFQIGKIASGGSFTPGVAFVITMVSALLYLLGLLIVSTLSLVYVTQPVIAKLVDGMVISGAEHLDSVQQRAADKGADAEGFADALDIGGAI